MASQESFPRATFQVMLEGNRRPNFGESEVTHKMPWSKSSRVRGFAGVVLGDSGSEVCRLADVVSAAAVHTFDQVHVVHRRDPMLAVMPAVAKPSARSRRHQEGRRVFCSLCCRVACQP